MLVQSEQVTMSCAGTNIRGGSLRAKGSKTIAHRDDVNFFPLNIESSDDISFTYQQVIFPVAMRSLAELIDVLQVEYAASLS
jgi:hypothetical protein